jgi:pimeloyl-ACP methyl ester carboxylesterase
MSILRVSGSNVEYREFGLGEPVVLLHSSASSGDQWRALGQRLGTRYNVIVPDLYGYGGTAQWPGQGPFHLEREAEIVLALLERAAGRAHLVGHSYGGAVALHVARRHGASLRSLTLIEPVAMYLLKGMDEAAFAEITNVADDVAHAVACGDYFGGFERFVDYWNGPGAWAGIPEAKRFAMAARLPKVLLDFYAALNESARLEDFGALTTPTMLVYGTCSPQPTRRLCKLLMQTLPHATLETIAGAGHMAPITHRDQVDTMIAAYIESNSHLASGRPADGGLRGTNLTSPAGAAG